MKTRTALFFTICMMGWLILPGGIATSQTLLPDAPECYRVLFEAREARGPKHIPLEVTEDETGYDVLHYNLEIRFDPTIEFVRGRVDMLMVSTVPELTDAAMHLYYNMNVDSILVDGEQTTYTHVWEDELTVDLPQTLGVGDSAQISIYYNGYPIYGSMGALYWDSHLGVPIIASLSEPEGARTWWPCKDMPCEKATARLVWTVPEDLYATGNGLLQSVTSPEPGWTSYEWVENYPITTYLIAVTATNFAHWRDWYVSVDGDSVPLDHYIYPEDSLHSLVDFADLPDVIAFFASVYGEYPFLEEKYGHAEFPWGGAMEHQTMTSYGENLITGNNYYHWIMVHELSHQWWGDLVTCETWADIWLNEGFAVYSDALWIEHDQGWQAFQNRMESFRQTYFWWEGYEGRFPIYDPVNMWGGTVYEKGAWILHMIRYVGGEENFWNFFPEYRSRYSFDAATTAELQETMEDVYAADLDWFFNEWVYMAGYPEYEWGWDLELIGADSARVDLRIEQVQELVNQTPIFTMPIEIGVATTTGYETHLVQNDQQTQYFSFNVSGIPLDVEFDPDIWILKTAEEVTYVPPLQTIALRPYNPPIVIPASGGSFDYNIAATNNEPAAVTLDVWIDLTLPDSSVFGPVLGPVTVTLPGNTTLDRDRTQSIPGRAPAGTYSYNAYLGIYPDSIVGDDAFSFEKLGTGEGEWIADWSNAGEGFEDWLAGSAIELPSEFAVGEVYPNPFNAETVIPLELPQRSRIHIELFNVQGRNLGTIYEGTKEAGWPKIRFNAAGLASGVYFYRVIAEGLERGGTYDNVGKMLLLK